MDMTMVPPQELEVLVESGQRELRRRRGGLLNDANAKDQCATDPRFPAEQVEGRGADRASSELTVDNVEQVFDYQPWMPDQIENGKIVREALVAAAKAILRVVPRCPARTIALNHLQDARMAANRAITWRGRF